MKKFNADLFSKTLSSIKWNFIGTIIKVISHFAVSIFLARLLSPEQFGVMGMLMIVIGFGRLISDLGLGAAIIQRAIVTPRHIRAAFTANWLFGIILFVINWSLSPFIAQAFKNPSITTALKVIGIIFLLGNFTVIPLALLRRELKNKILNICEIISYILGYGFISIFLAYKGLGVWSLVFGTLAQYFILAILLIIIVHPPMMPLAPSKEYREILGFGMDVAGLNVTNYVASSAPGFFIARNIGSEFLGLYNRAFTLVSQPIGYIVSMLGSVMFPAFSKIQNNLNQLRRNYLRTLYLVNLISMPLLFAMIPASRLILTGLYGEQWGEASVVMQFLSIEAWSRSLLVLAGNLSHAKDRVRAEWLNHTIYLILISTTIFISVKYSLNTIAFFVTIFGIVRYLLLGNLTIRIIGINWAIFLKAHIPGMILSAISLSCSFFSVMVVNSTKISSSTLKLLFAACIGFILFLGIVLIIPKKLIGEEIYWLYEKLRGKIPAIIIRILDWKLKEK